MKAANKQVAVLTVLVVVLAVLNLVQMAMTPSSASAESAAKPKLGDVSKYRGGERAATTDAVKAVNATLQEVLVEIKGMRADLTAGKLSVRIQKSDDAK